MFILIETKENLSVILNKIESDGWVLSRFNEKQKVEIIKAYAEICYDDGLIK